MQMRRLRDVSIFHGCRIDGRTPFKIGGETVLDVKEVDGKVHFDLGRIDVISDPSDMYVFAKDDNFILREDLEK